MRLTLTGVYVETFFPLTLPYLDMVYDVCFEAAINQMAPSIGILNYAWGIFSESDVLKQNETAKNPSFLLLSYVSSSQIGHSEC